MIHTKLFEEFNSKLSEAFAHGPMAGPLKDFEKNAKALMLSVFAKMDLVTREEFDIQREMLSRAQEKLRELEDKIAALEATRSQN